MPDMDLINEGAQHEELSNVVRHYAATKLYDLIERMQPEVDDTVRMLGDYDASSKVAATGVIRAYLAALKDLSQMYQLHLAPVSEEPMLPASQVLELAQARVDEAVESAVAEALEAREAEVLEARRVGADEARAKVARVVGSVRSRS